MARWDDKSAKCPFYSTNDECAIICEGISNNTKIVLRFTKEKTKAAYKDTYCDAVKCYSDCRIAKMLMGKYDAK